MQIVNNVLIKVERSEVKGNYFKIPEGITEIGDSACAFLSPVFYMHIPDSVKAIGERAFLGCGNLKHVTIPHSVKRIDNSAFAQCVNLCSVRISSSLVSIGARVFADCRELQYFPLPQSLESMGTDIFIGCKNVLLNSQPIEKKTFEYWANDWLIFRTLAESDTDADRKFIMKNNWLATGLKITSYDHKQ